MKYRSIISRYSLEIKTRSSGASLISSAILLAQLTRGDEIDVAIRFRGGATHDLHLPIPLPAWQLRQTSMQVVRVIDRLLDDHTEVSIAQILNSRGLRSGQGKAFSPSIVKTIRRDYQLKHRYQHLRDSGMLTIQEMAGRLKITTTTVKIWRRHGILCGHAYNDKNECLFEPPDQDAPKKAQGRKLSERRVFTEVESDRTKEVQCEA